MTPGIIPGMADGTIPGIIPGTVIIPTGDLPTGIIPTGAAEIALYVRELPCAREAAVRGWVIIFQT